MKRYLPKVLMGGAFLLATSMTAQAEETKTSEEITINQDENKTNNDNEWKKAKQAGFSFAQYKQIMEIPTVDDVAETYSTKLRSTSSGDRVVQVAEQQIGIPYVWGGDTPEEGFDCSGLVQYSYKKAINQQLPRVTTEQEQEGKEVSLSNLQKGDLLFYGEKGSTYHVSIYAGNGCSIQAPKPGENVQKINIKYYYPDFARRVITEAPKAVADDAYQSVVSGSEKIYRNTELTSTRGTTGDYYKNTLHTKRYYTINNQRYYSAYDKDDNWIGYIKANALERAKTKGGKYYSLSNTYGVVKAEYSRWSNFDFTAKKGVTAVNNQYRVKGQYYHFNGNKYYSLYNKDDQWCGYVNANSLELATNDFGVYHSFGKNVTVIKDGYGIYQDKNFKKKVKTSDDVKNKTFYAKGYYNRFDGTRYYSLYSKNSDGMKWEGYIRSTAVKVCN